MEAVLFIWSKNYNLDLPWVMSLNLVPHLPKLVMTVAKYFMCERKVSNLIFYFLVILFISSYFINNQGKQHKMLKKRLVIKWCNLNDVI